MAALAPHRYLPQPLPDAGEHLPALPPLLQLRKLHLDLRWSRQAFAAGLVGDRLTLCRLVRRAERSGFWGRREAWSWLADAWQRGEHVAHLERWLAATESVNG